MMKHLAAAILLMSTLSLPASAILEGDGYYRVQNYLTDRYIYVLDDKGELNFQATTAELGAIELWKGYENAISDPATVIYVTDLNGQGKDYDLQTQGTGVNKIINYPVSIYMNNKKLGIYSIFGRNSGLTRYIGDATKTGGNQGWMTSLGNGDNFRWYFHPMTTDDSNYFGITPEISDGGDHYATLYADFPFTFASSGMEAYKVYAVIDGVAYLDKLEGVIERGTPVVVKCSSDQPSGNKLNIGGSGRPVGGNILKGVYFCNTTLKHRNITPYDPSTMRVLGRLSDGSIGFVTADVEKLPNLPRNKAYLTVPAGSPAEIRISYEEPAGINDIVVERPLVKTEGLTIYISGVAAAELYNITGRRVATFNAADGASITVDAPGLYLLKTPSSTTKVLLR